MNIKNLFLLIIMAGMGSIANAADIRTVLINTVPGSAVALAHGPQLNVPLRYGVDPNTTITNEHVWYNINRHLNSGRINLYDAHGIKIEHNNDFAKQPYDPNTTYAVESDEPVVAIVAGNGLFIQR